MKLRQGLTTFLLVAGIAASTGLLAVVLGIPGCGSGGPPNGTKCSQCGDTDGPCDNPQRLGTVCWDTNEACTSDQDCVSENRCLEFSECTGSGNVCSSDGDCGEAGSVCGKKKRCLGGFDKECTSDSDCAECVPERLACLRKQGSAQRICFDLNLRNTPELQCGAKFTLEGASQTTPTPTPTPSPTPGSTGTATATTTPSPTPTP